MNFEFEADRSHTANSVDTLTRLIQFEQIKFLWVPFTMIMDLRSFD
jgi:hypothetical protein